MRLVLDTNVIVSALFWGGKPRAILDYAYKHATLFFSNETFEELETVLGYAKFQPYIKKSSFHIHEFLDRLTEHAIRVPFVAPLMVIKDDPRDDKFLACALVAHADAIVSGDKHLLRLARFYDIPIMDTTTFLRQFCK